jgi:hypothetical protein
LSRPFSPTISAGFGSFASRLSRTSLSIAIGFLRRSFFPREKPFTQSYLNPPLLARCAAPFVLNLIS